MDDGEDVSAGVGRPVGGEKQGVTYALVVEGLEPLDVEGEGARAVGNAPAKVTFPSLRSNSKVHGKLVEARRRRLKSLTYAVG